MNEWMHEDWDYEGGRVLSAFTRYPRQKKKAKKETKTMPTSKKTLYETTVDGKTVYGTYLATNSEGHYVLEIKGSGELQSFERDVLEEVLPYSVGVTFNDGGTVYHFQTEKGKLKVGDFVVRTDYGDFTVCRVVEINSKSKQATKRLVGYKLQGEVL